MQSPSAPASQAQPDEHALQIARLGLLFVCAVSPRTVEFASKKLADLFGHQADVADLRAAQQQLLAESSEGLAKLLRRAR